MNPCILTFHFRGTRAAPRLHVRGALVHGGRAGDDARGVPALRVRTRRAVVPAARLRGAARPAAEEVPRAAQEGGMLSRAALSWWVDWWCDMDTKSRFIAFLCYTLIHFSCSSVL